MSEVIVPLERALDLPEPLHPPHWTEFAECQYTDPETFFPEKGGSTRPAKRICAGCEVQPQCLDFALARPELFGVWGGLSERERQQLRVTRLEEAA